MSETTSALPLSATALMARFTFRPELALLYDRLHGLEHRLNSTAVALVAATFTEADPVAAFASRYGIDVNVAVADLQRFWRDRLDAPSNRHPERKSGAPSDWAAVDVPFPLALEVELTRACNWHCDFCYNVWKVPDDHGRRGRSDSNSDATVHMPVLLAKRIIEEAAENGCLRMRFSGGEPTMHPDYRTIIETATAAGLDTELFTNGTRMSEDEAIWLADKGLRVVLLSLHGLPDTHARMASNPAASKHAWQGIHACVAAGMTTVVETLVCQDNVEEMPELVRRLVDTGVRHVSFMPYVPFSSEDPRRPLLLRQVADVIDRCQDTVDHAVSIRVPCAPRHCLESTPVAIEEPVRPEFDDHCAAGILWASVSYDGRLRHCPHSSVYAGSITAGIGDLWRSILQPTVRAALTPQGACAGCSQFAACGGGCHLNKITSYPDTTVGSRRSLPLVPIGGPRQ